MVHYWPFLYRPVITEYGNRITDVTRALHLEVLFNWLAITQRLLGHRKHGWSEPVVLALDRPRKNDHRFQRRPYSLILRWS